MRDEQLPSFEYMFRRFQPALVKFAFMHLRDMEASRGAVQEVFINVWEKRDRLEFGDDLKGYLYRAVRNHCLNMIKKKKLDTMSLDEGLVAAEQENNAAEELKQDRIAMIFREIEQLPANCREIFLLSRVEGLSHKEIAEVLDISPKTVENQVGIALKKIRNNIKTD